FVNCAFLRNGGTAIQDQSPGVVTARINYWDSATGPGGSGNPGTGQAVTGNVRFDPWLTATPSATSFFSSATPTNGSGFNPSPGVGINAHIAFATPTIGSWTVTVSDSGSNTMQTTTGSGTSGNVTWNG